MKNQNPKIEGPAGSGLPNGAENIAQAAEQSAGIITSTPGALAHPKIKAIRRGPGGKAEWLITLDGVCTDAPMRDRRLRNYRKFCNVIQFRFGIQYSPMSQAEWTAVVEAAIREGGDA
jgi:hypothetical protein